MAMQVSRPQRPDHSALFSMVGSLGGAAIGGAPGAVVGGGLGGMMGGQAAQGPGPIAANESPISRRMVAMQMEPKMTAREGFKAFTQLPPDMRSQYARPVIESYKKITGKLPSQDFGEGVA